jgi:TatD DNase family protein
MSEELGVVYTDTHCHLEMLEGEFPRAIVDRARTASVRTLVTVGVDLASSAECVQTASAEPDVWAVVGIHPHNAIEATPTVLDRLRRLAGHPSVVGIGETGLDYYRDHSPRAQQHLAFRAQIRLAKVLDKTLVIHCREAHEDVFDTLLDEGAPERVVFHCFSGDADFATRCAEQGWFLSFSGTVTFTNAPDVRDAATKVPPELLLTETDAPYLSPHPHRGQTNEPARVPLVAATLARLHGMSVEDMGALTTANARRAFGLPSAVGAGPAIS